MREIPVILSYSGYYKFSSLTNIVLKSVLKKLNERLKDNYPTYDVRFDVVISYFTNIHLRIINFCLELSFFSVLRCKLSVDLPVTTH